MASDDGSRLELRFEGLRTSDGTMDVALFTGAVLSVDLLFRVAMDLLEARSAPGLRVDTRIRHGSIIVTLIALAAAGVGPSPQDGFHAVKALLWVGRSMTHVLVDGIRSVTGSMTAVDAYREFHERSGDRVAAEKSRRDRAIAEADTADARRLREIVRLYDEAQRGGRDPEKTLRNAQALFAQSRLSDTLAPAIAQVALPLSTGESDHIVLEGGRTPPLALGTQDVPSFNELKRKAGALQGVVAAEEYLPELFGAPVPVLLEAVVEVVGPRYDRKRSGWRVRLNGRVVSAVLEDVEFVDQVADGEQIMLPSTRCVVRYHQRSQNVIVIEKVLRIMDAP